MCRRRVDRDELPAAVVVGRELAAVHAPGVESDRVVAFHRALVNSVSEEDPVGAFVVLVPEGAVVPRAVWRTHRQEFLDGVVRERPLGVDTAVDHDGVVERDDDRQRLEVRPVAVAEPPGVLVAADDLLFVVPADAHQPVVVADQIDHAGAVGALPDEVTDEDDAVLGTRVERREQRLQRGSAAVDVTDDVDVAVRAGVDPLVYWFDGLAEFWGFGHGQIVRVAASPAADVRTGRLPGVGLMAY